MRPLLVASLVLTTAACQGKADGVRERFSASFTCPADRVEVRERADVTPSMLRVREELPADIKADPGRLAMWREKQAKSDQASDSSCEMFEARGCGKQSLYCCSRPPRHMNRVSCFSQDYANGVSRW